MSVQDTINRMTYAAFDKIDAMTDAFEAAATEKYGAIPPRKSSEAIAWQEGYWQGVIDERTAAGWDYPALPNRANPYEPEGGDR